MEEHASRQSCLKVMDTETKTKEYSKYYFFAGFYLILVLGLTLLIQSITFFFNGGIRWWQFPLALVTLDSYRLMILTGVFDLHLLKSYLLRLGLGLVHGEVSANNLQNPIINVCHLRNRCIKTGSPKLRNVAGIPQLCNFIPYY